MEPVVNTQANNQNDVQNENIDFNSIFQSALETENNQQEETPPNYTLQDEKRARALAEQAMHQERMKKIQGESKAQASAITKVMSQYETKIKALEAKISEIESFKNKADNKLNDIDTKSITQDVLKEEEQIMNDPVISGYYKADEVQKNLFEQAGKGRTFSPYEMTAILNFYPLAQELARLKENDENRRELMNSSLFSRSKNDEALEKRLSDVKTEDEAMRILKRELDQKYSI